MPYLYSCAVETHRTGVPTMRAMVLEFPGEENPADIPCADLDRQYMLGDRLLVAPVFSKEGNVEYFLPAGTWTSLLDNRVVEGGRWVRETHDFMSLPLMVRENSILPLGGDNQNVEYDYGKDLTLHVFRLNTQAAAEIKDKDGEDLLSVTGKNENNTLRFTFAGKAENLRILLRNVFEISSVTGAEAEKTDQGVLLTVNGDLSEVTVKL